MRIIAGKYRGKKLVSPKTGEVRPTADRAKEALFSILSSKLGNDWENRVFLDVFAGSGAIGLEALSRGVQKVGFIDINPNNAAQNIRIFPQEAKNIKIYKYSVENLPIATEKYNMVFLDAPYGKNLSAIALKELVEKMWLTDDAIIVAEIQKNEELSAPEGLSLTDERVLGAA